MRVLSQHQVHQALELCKRDLETAQRALHAATLPEEKAVWSYVVRILQSKRNPAKRGCCG